MKLEKLIRYCLQYLEQDSETNVMDTKNSYESIEQNDTFSEYTNNISGSIYMGITRYASSLVIPVKEVEIGYKPIVVLESAYEEMITTGLYMFNSISEEYYKVGKDIPFNPTSKYYIRSNTSYLTDDLTPNGNPKHQKVKYVYSVAEDTQEDNDVKYSVVGNKLVIKDFNNKKKYFVVYHPIINDLDTYKEDVNDLELRTLGITDEMAINLKYFVYSDMKLDENPNVANINKSYFENFLNELVNRGQVDNNYDANTYGWGVDIYGD